MGHPINTNSAVIKSVHVARVQSAEQQRDETRRRQFAMTLQQEAAHKKTQVQDSHKAEEPGIRKEQENKDKRRKRQKRTHEEPVDEKQGSEEEVHHIDLKID